ncbi:MAG: phosphate/phosphite/phosphonate ABC transporter substrate-binding protein [Pseudomonadales bacterium]
MVLRLPRALYVLMLAVLAMVQSACGPAEPASASLKLAYLPSEEDTEERMEAFQLLADHISTHVSQPVEIIRASSYAPTIEAMRAKKIDIIRSGGSFTYMIAHEKANAEAIVAVGTTSAGPGLYQSALVTAATSGIKTVADLRARSREIDFAFVDPASTSGHLVPRSFLEKQGINPEKDFKQLIFTMSHLNSIMTIRSGKVDAGAISLSTYNRMVEQGRLDPAELTVLWTSPPIPTGPVMVRQDLPETLKKGIQAAYLALNNAESPLMEAMRAVYNREDLRFFPAEDRDWDGLRQIAHNLETMVLLNPEG